ncbi:MAG: hypothetical protein IPJ12_02255 [Betaproteobacteria bacterium]|nr:hypothetical protein [Betaproteobacteria bacterium]
MLGLVTISCIFTTIAGAWFPWQGLIAQVKPMLLVSLYLEELLQISISQLKGQLPNLLCYQKMRLKVGQAYLGLQDDKNAEVAFKKAWEANPEYWPAYLWWAQRLMQQGKQHEAATVAEEGLKNAPGSKPLERLIAEMRGSGKATRK